MQLYINNYLTLLGKTDIDSEPVTKSKPLVEVSGELITIHTYAPYKEATSTVSKKTLPRIGLKRQCKSRRVYHIRVQ
jgi:hypothetical protein